MSEATLASNIKIYRYLRVTYDTFYFDTRNIGNTDNDDNEVYVRRTR